MSHPEQFAFFEAVSAANREHISGARIIEIGSYDVNGTVRSLFGLAEEYVGVDLQEGPGVDLVGYGHEIAHPDASYDVALSGECFEHDPYWVETFSNMCRMTRPGGLVAFTCASRGRPEHGTVRTELRESPGTQAEGLDYYKNLTELDFRQSVPLDEFFSRYQFWYMPTSFDLYFAGIRAADVSGTTARLPDQKQVEAISDLMSFPHRVARMPLRMATALIPEAKYQDVILPYWMGLIRLQDRFGGGFRRTPVAD